MTEGSSRYATKPATVSKDVQLPDLDDVDRRLLTLLHADARMSNSALADAVGIAASTCSTPTASP